MNLVGEEDTRPQFYGLECIQRARVVQDKKEAQEQADKDQNFLEKGLGRSQ